MPNRQSLDSLGFSLPALTEAEQRARAQCQAAEQSQARIRDWTAVGAATHALAAAPASDPPKKLKQLARGGIPQLLRPTLWYQLSGGQALRARKPEGYYDSLTMQADGARSPKSVVVTRAELEAFNAFPTHSLLTSIKGLGAVRRLVMAHSLHSGAATYNMGIVSVAAFLLAVMGVAREEEAFWTLCALRELRLHPLHYENMRGCRVEQMTLNELTRRRCPRTATLFDRAGCSLSEVTGEWMEALFTRSLPPETAARVLDVLLLEGSKTLQRIGVALFKCAEAGLLQSCKSLQVAQVLRWRIARTYAADALLKTAYPAIPGGVISSASIEQLRSVHQMTVAGEKVDIVRRLTTMASTPAAPLAVPSGRPLAALVLRGGVISRSTPTLLHRAGSGGSGPSLSGSELPPEGDLPEGGLSEEEEEAHAEAQRALSEHGSPREQVQMASLSMLLRKPEVVLQAARSI